MKQTLFRALFGISMLCLILCTALFGTIFYTGWKEDFHTALLMEAKTIVALSQPAESTVSTPPTISLSLLKDISSKVDPQLRLTWISPDGHVYYDSDSDAASMENHSHRPEVQAALRTGEGSDIRHSSTLQAVNYYEALRLADGSVLRISRVGTTIYALLFQALPWMLGIFIAITALCYYLARRWTKHLILLDTMAKELKEQQHRAEFTSNVSHELRTPLTTIQGYSELLAKGMYQSSDDVSMLGNHIHKAAKHMSELIENILKLSRIEEGSRDIAKESLLLDDVISGAWSHLKPKWQTKSITTDFRTANLRVVANRKLLEDVFVNLFDNAIKFSKPTHNTITVRAKRQGQATLITVADEGIGIAKDKLPRIFERFYQTNESRNSRHEGSGLGLSLVKHIMDVHGGTVSVKSELHKGTEFTLRLPSGE